MYIYITLQNSMIAGTLKSDWAILLALLILAIFQGYKIWIDAKTAKGRAIFDKRLEDVMNNIELYLKILSDKYTEEVTDIQMPIIVNEFVAHTEEAILFEAAASIARNNVNDQKREIEEKIQLFICNRYREMYTNFGRFKWKGKYLNEFVPMEKKKELIKNTLLVVTKDRNNNTETLKCYRALNSSVRQHFDALRNEIKSNAYG